MKLGIVFLVCLFAAVSVQVIQEASAENVLRLENTPQRIISLGQSITEALYSLGAEDQVMGVTTYCNKPARAQDKEKIGTSIAIDVEKIISLRPDLILATSLTDKNSITKLRQIGLKVEVFAAPINFEQLCEQYLEIAKLLGREAAAAASIAKARKELEHIHSIAYSAKPRVIAQVGASPLWFAPRDTFINDFIEFAGGDNIIPAGNGSYSREKILAQNPDVIIVTTMGMAGYKEKEQWQKFKHLSAVKNKRIYIVDSDKLCSAVPESFVVTLREVAELLHPNHE